MLSRSGIILTFATVTLVLGDASDAFAQAALSSDQPLLYAEAGKRRWRRRRRARKAPPPEKAAAEATEEPVGPDNGGAVDEGGPAAPAPEDGSGESESTKLENPFQDESPETPVANPESEVSGDGGGSLRRSNRMDFDDRLVKGQGARSGAVYLFKRTPRKLPELVSLRTSYRGRIVDPVLGRRSVQAPTKAPTKAAGTARPAPAKAPEASPEEGVEETDAQKAAKAKALRRRRWRRRMLRRRRAAKRAKKAQ